MFHVIFFEPRIPGNTGSAIRMSAATGATLHLVEPLGFELSDSHLKRAGLDYHDLAHVMVHANLDAALAEIASLGGSGRVFAFTRNGAQSHADIAYEPGDALLFGPEPTGLSDEVLADSRVTSTVFLPMLPGVRSLNLSNAAAIVMYEAWRQHGFDGA